jgi:glucose 1-dehydrogenase
MHAKDEILLGKTAVVTGSSSGIGRGIALVLAQAGADVAVSYHSGGDAAAMLAGEIENLGSRVFCAQLNVADPESIERYFAAAQAALGPIDILVNNAGIDGPTALVAEADIAGWDLVQAVNLRGPFLCARQVLPGMIARRSGVVLTISSVHETIPWAGHAAYCAAKAGVAMLTRTLALEMQDNGVRVVGLAPGAIRTPINKDVWDDPAQMADLLTKIPIGRIGEVEEVANMVRFIVSREASYLTGVTVTLDGGMSAYPSFAHGG